MLLCEKQYEVIRISELRVAGKRHEAALGFRGWALHSRNKALLSNSSVATLFLCQRDIVWVVDPEEAVFPIPPQGVMLINTMVLLHSLPRCWQVRRQSGLSVPRTCPESHVTCHVWVTTVCTRM
jgi:hypothetical protein